MPIGLPLVHRLKGQTVLVLGDGNAAAAKIRLLEAAGARIWQPTQWPNHADIEQAGVRLAFIATDDKATASQAAQHCRAARLLLNVVDQPDLCDFTVPALVDRQPLLLAISSDGASASLVKALKERLEQLLPPQLGALTRAIAAAKAEVKDRYPNLVSRRLFWANLLAPGGRLDPWQPQDNASAIIAEALAANSQQPADTALNRRDRIAVPKEGADALRLKELRLLAAADLVIHPANLPADIMALLRRDADRQIGDQFVENKQLRQVLLV